MTCNSCLYAGQVTHQRHRPRWHRLRYSVFAVLLDLDELPVLDHNLRLFGHNRRAIYSFHDSDHGDGLPGGLRAWIVRQLVAAGVAIDGIRIGIVCYPRILGFVFNPLTVYFCSGHDGRVRAVLYEVCNTFQERHTYVIPVADPSGDVIRQSCPKALYVSPFIPMDCFYNFRISLPEERVAIVINEHDSKGPVLVASFTGARVELSDRRLLSMLFTYPLMTLKVIGGIHWEALRLWLKGVPVHRHVTARTTIATTVVPLNSLKESQHESG
ncbi:DUF1365 family protein [Rhizobium cauense]|uniref:DUF1365 domain-containing protein n=1 Tax=Rhizobium cauense TaxID=1166683 RepID=UPI001C6F3182|nr:DUF1365 family protein [Rhizobium cauense]MBW9116559.1 DUF1365 family protein [Rhizobium cauense]